MKNLLLLTFILLTSVLQGQIKNDSLTGVNILDRTSYSESDTIPIVINIDNAKKQKNAVWYLNGQLINEQIATTINPNRIQEIKIEKEPVDLNTTNTKGIIYIRTKEYYNPNWISLNELKVKYTNIASDQKPTLFLLDDKLIKMDYDAFKVDEKYILKIEVQSVENSKENLALNVIRLITRTPENVRKANTIRLKGNE